MKRPLKEPLPKFDVGDRVRAFEVSAPPAGVWRTGRVEKRRRDRRRGWRYGVLLDVNFRGKDLRYYWEHDLRDDTDLITKIGKLGDLSGQEDQAQAVQAVAPAQA